MVSIKYLRLLLLFQRPLQIVKYYSNIVINYLIDLIIVKYYSNIVI